jgi:hypothetical protein
MWGGRRSFDRDTGFPLESPSRLEGAREPAARDGWAASSLLPRQDGAPTDGSGLSADPRAGPTIPDILDGPQCSPLREVFVLHALLGSGSLSGL